MLCLGWKELRCRNTSRSVSRSATFFTFQICFNTDLETMLLTLLATHIADVYAFGASPYARSKPLHPGTVQQIELWQRPPVFSGSNLSVTPSDDVSNVLSRQTLTCEGGWCKPMIPNDQSNQRILTFPRLLSSQRPMLRPKHRLLRKPLLSTRPSTLRKCRLLRSVQRPLLW